MLLHFLRATAEIPGLRAMPNAGGRQEIERGFEFLASRLRARDDAALTGRIDTITAHPQGRALMETVFRYSPFLTRLIWQYPDFFADCCERGPDACFPSLLSPVPASHFTGAPALMKHLRILKSKASLVIALADIAGVWTLETVTGAMSQLADHCTRLACRFVLTKAAAKGLFTPAEPDAPEQGLGFFVLAMGKLGANELNYSSDIDLIVFFDREQAEAAGIEYPQQQFPKLTQELVRLLHERTMDGYVFRTDLRLRPDPASTPVALSTAGAITYYETVGQNWERAALIKARPIAGDLEAGHRFLKQIAPFLWRKHLDFAAIADIQSIKRQMDAKSGGVIDLAGHNVKTGIGGIREIEFFAQIHQLIWGGRIAALRLSGSCQTLEKLAEYRLVTEELSRHLIASYRFFRHVEHRLQMVDDQQTHSLPVKAADRAVFAAFCGFESAETFERDLLSHLNFVHKNFAESFQGQGSLGSDEGKLSFTGVENDPQTVETIRRMGFHNPASVSEIIQSWHRGTRRATRTKRARELITELTPVLLKALAATVQPDQAFIRFDEFLTHLPAGVQLFSLFQANRHLLDLIALIMGSAPAMAESLSKTPSLLDTVLTADFFREFSDAEALAGELTGLLIFARDFEDEMDIIRRFKNEKQFQTGVQLIRHQADAQQAGRHLSDVAEACVRALLESVEIRLREKQPGLPENGLAVLALGRLGAQALTFGSDLDLIFLYEDASETSSPSLYYKLSQRFIGAVTALTGEGRLYEIDMRLRPSGNDGALAISVDAFDKYYAESAWTFEFMALTRARVIAGNARLQESIRSVVVRHLTSRRGADSLKADIGDLRSRVAREFGSSDLWNLKYTPGGLMDIDFLAQFYVLLHAHAAPPLLSGPPSAVFARLGAQGLLAPDTAKTLGDAHDFLNALFVMLRLCGGGKLEEVTAPQGLKQLLARAMQLSDFDAVKEKLAHTLRFVDRYISTLLPPSQAPAVTL